MPQWLVEDLGFIALLLGVAAGVLFFFWWRDRKRKQFLVAAGGTALVAVALAVTWGLVRYFGETDEKQIRTALDEMAEGVKTRNLERLFAQVSTSFRYGVHDKQAFRSKSEEVIRRRDVTEVVIWEFRAGEVSRAKRTAHVEFLVKPRGNWGGEVYYLCRAEFVLDPDNKWRLKGFNVFNPYSDINTPLQIPGF